MLNKSLEKMKKKTKMCLRLHRSLKANKKQTIIQESEVEKIAPYSDVHAMEKNNKNCFFEKRQKYKKNRS